MPTTGERVRRTAPVVAALVLGTVSAAAYLVMWLSHGDGCTGTGTVIHGCEAFECVHGDELLGVELLLVGPAMAALLIWGARARLPRWARVMVWTAGVGWLVAGRFALYLGLADVVVRHCIP